MRYKFIPKLYSLNSRNIFGLKENCVCLLLEFNSHVRKTYVVTSRIVIGCRQGRQLTICYVSYVSNVGKFNGLVHKKLCACL